MADGENGRQALSVLDLMRGTPRTQYSISKRYLYTVFSTITAAKCKRVGWIHIPKYHQRAHNNRPMRIERSDANGYG